MSNRENINQTEPIISIGTLAEKLGISVSTIRKYEAEGLLISHRTKSGHRLFSLEDIERIKIIQNLIQQSGLNIEGIRRLQAFLPCWDILPCALKDRKTCPAFKHQSKPCWMITGLECSNGKTEKCRLCVVYRFGTLRTEDIKKFTYWDNTKKNLSKLIKSLIDNWKQ